MCVHVRACVCESEHYCTVNHFTSYLLLDRCPNVLNRNSTESFSVDAPQVVVISSLQCSCPYESHKLLTFTCDPGSSCLPPCFHTDC